MLHCRTVRYGKHKWYNMRMLSDSLFNEKAADKEIEKSLRKHIKFLEGELKMARVIKSVDGKYYTGDFEEVSPDQVTQMIAKRQSELQELEAIAPANSTPPAPDNGGTDNGSGQGPVNDGGQPSGDSAPAPGGDNGTPTAPPADPNAAALDTAATAGTVDQTQTVSPPPPVDPNPPAPALPGIQ